MSKAKAKAKAEKKALGRYEELGMKESLHRMYQYPIACKELSFILRLAYNQLPKVLQSLIFQDTLTAFRLLPQYVFLFLFTHLSNFVNSSFFLWILLALVLISLNCMYPVGFSDWYCWKKIWVVNCDTNLRKFLVEFQLIISLEYIRLCRYKDSIKIWIKIVQI